VNTAPALPNDPTNFLESILAPVVDFQSPTWQEAAPYDDEYDSVKNTPDNLHRKDN
jgi:hypothetical protein